CAKPGAPGQKLYGVSLQLTETTGKRLELLRELVPGEAPLAVLWDPRAGSYSWQVADSSARGRGWKLLSLEGREASEIEAAFKVVPERRAGALLVIPSALLDRHARRIVELAAKRRVPAMYGLRLYVEAGGLMSYGADYLEPWGRAAVFVDKILKGA